MSMELLACRQLGHLVISEELRGREPIFGRPDQAAFGFCALDALKHAAPSI